MIQMLVLLKQDRINKIVSTFINGIKLILLILVFVQEFYRDTIG